MTDEITDAMRRFIENDKANQRVAKIMKEEKNRQRPQPSKEGNLLYWSVVTLGVSAVAIGLRTHVHFLNAVSFVNHVEKLPRTERRQALYDIAIIKQLREQKVYEEPFKWTIIPPSHKERRNHYDSYRKAVEEGRFKVDFTAVNADTAAFEEACEAMLNKKEKSAFKVDTAKSVSFNLRFKQIEKERA